MTARRSHRRTGSGRARALLASLCAMSLAGSVTAGPRGEQVVAGQASVTREGAQTTIRASDNAVLRFESFDIGVAEGVRFIQPSERSRVLNQILGSEPTRIDGSLTANGRVFLVNPAGIVFGHAAVVNVGGLLAAAGSLSTEDFLANRDIFTSLSGPVENHGTLDARVVTLLGQKVVNTGTVNASDGQATLVAGGAVYLSQAGSDAIVKLESGGGPLRVVDPGIDQRGAILADEVNMVVGDAYAFAMGPDALVQAPDIRVESRGTGRISVSGTLDAASAETAGTGGRISLLGDEIVVTGATLDASGEAGGGRIHVGGQARGAGSSTAERVFLDVDSTLRADARLRGSGGEVVVFAAEQALIDAALSARGGALAGDGGFIETSGRQLLDITRAPDLSAANGRGGHWLIDPLNVAIRNRPNGPQMGEPRLGQGEDGVFRPSPSESQEDSVISSQMISRLLSDGINVTIDTNVEGKQAGDITQDADALISFLEPQEPGLLFSGLELGTLDLNATGNIELSGGIRGVGPVRLNAGGSVTLDSALNAASLSVGASRFATTTRGAILTDAVQVNAGAIDLGAPLEGGVVAFNTDSLRTSAGAPILAQSFRASVGLEGPGRADLSGSVQSSTSFLLSGASGSVFRIGGDLTTNGFLTVGSNGGIVELAGADLRAASIILGPPPVEGGGGQVRVVRNGVPNTLIGQGVSLGTLLDDPSSAGTAVLRIEAAQIVLNGGFLGGSLEVGSPQVDAPQLRLAGDLTVEGDLTLDTDVEFSGGPLQSLSSTGGDVTLGGVLSKPSGGSLSLSAATGVLALNGGFVVGEPRAVDLDLKGARVLLNAGIATGGGRLGIEGGSVQSGATGILDAGPVEILADSIELSAPVSGTDVSFDAPLVRLSADVVASLDLEIAADRVELGGDASLFAGDELDVASTTSGEGGPIGGGDVALLADAGSHLFQAPTVRVGTLVGEGAPGSTPSSLTIAAQSAQLDGAAIQGALRIGGAVDVSGDLLAGDLVLGSDVTLSGAGAQILGSTGGTLELGGSLTKATDDLTLVADQILLTGGTQSLVVGDGSLALGGNLTKLFGEGTGGDLSLSAAQILLVGSGSQSLVNQGPNDLILDGSLSKLTPGDLSLTASQILLVSEGTQSLANGGGSLVLDGDVTKPSGDLSLSAQRIELALGGARADPDATTVGGLFAGLAPCCDGVVQSVVVLAGSLELNTAPGATAFAPTPSILAGRSLLLQAAGSITTGALERIAVNGSLEMQAGTGLGIGSIAALGDLVLDAGVGAITFLDGSPVLGPAPGGGFMIPGSEPAVGLNLVASSIDIQASSVGDGPTLLGVATADGAASFTGPDGLAVAIVSGDPASAVFQPAPFPVVVTPPTPPTSMSTPLITPRQIAAESALPEAPAESLSRLLSSLILPTADSSILLSRPLTADEMLEWLECVLNEDCEPEEEDFTDPRLETDEKQKLQKMWAELFGDESTIPGRRAVQELLDAFRARPDASDQVDGIALRGFLGDQGDQAVVAQRYLGELDGLVDQWRKALAGGENIELGAACMLEQGLQVDGIDAGELYALVVGESLASPGRCTAGRLDFGTLPDGSASATREP